MRIEFKVDQREIDKLMRDLSAYGGRVAKKIEKETGYAALEVQQLAARKAPHNLGRLGASIQVQRQARSVKISQKAQGPSCAGYLYSRYAFTICGLCRVRERSTLGAYWTVKAMG